MTRTTPELAPPSPNFHATPAGGRLATTYDLACSRPHTRRIFSGIGFRAWNPPPQSRDLTTRPPRPPFYKNLYAVRFPSREQRSHEKKSVVPFHIGGKQQDSYIWTSLTRRAQRNGFTQRAATMPRNPSLSANTLAVPFGVIPE
ncbi:hypothetical protein AVEN_67688-1 [Araneus ventricosus]|uniref:Uncharacterized protein n=1 Tax=Araneus ventricosus TaxID=182803 RepID=A0A4Y2TT71_ARAVE|nr:hypothetical protein AVEN_67688-1 [Araneus ventricosus]